MILVGHFWSIAYNFLWTGTVLAFFHSLGKHSFSKQFLKRVYKGFAIEEAHNFTIRIDISSCPWALLGSNDLTILIMSSTQNAEVDSFFFSCKRYIRWNGTAVIYCGTLLIKQLWNKFAFTKKSVTSWFPTGNGGIKGILVPLTNVFNVFQ